MNLTLKLSNDGSHTIYREDIDETYHSIHGAIQEAEHVFIKKGIDYLTKKNILSNINILEIGFGTGLNALLTANYSLDNKQKISYIGIEKHPLDTKIIKKLNYSILIDKVFTKKHFDLIHNSEWGKTININKYIALCKIKTTLEELILEENIDLIYYDAFGPKSQPEMWHIDNFYKLYNILSIGGVLVTYCAKGQVRRDLQKVGFDVERLEGPPGKREMLRAIK